MSFAKAVLVWLSIALVCASCATPANVDIELPPTNGDLDYQLGGSYPPPDGVEIVTRDRTDSPVPGLYNICYINGFQTQPQEADWWLSTHPQLLLRDGEENIVTDPEWPDELILDTSPNRHQELIAIVGNWIDDCAASGFDAIEIDNLDTYSRFPEFLRVEDAVSIAQALTERAHGANLAAGQKNAPELPTPDSNAIFDFAVVEQCNQYDECELFTAVYASLVFVIEYDRRSFERGCAEFPELSILFRDLGLSTPSAAAYVYDSC